MVDGVLPLEDELGDGHEGVALLEQGLDDGGQGLRSVEGGVVEQHDGAGLHPGGDPLDDLVRGELLPVQAVHKGNGFNICGAAEQTMKARKVSQVNDSAIRQCEAPVILRRVKCIPWHEGGVQ